MTVAVLIPVVDGRPRGSASGGSSSARSWFSRWASVGCGRGPLPMLVVMRVLQGMGGTADGAGRPGWRCCVPPESRSGAGHRGVDPAGPDRPGAGPALGGAIATTGSWRWIFIVNIPLGSSDSLLALGMIRGDPASGAGRWTGPDAAAGRRDRDIVDRSEKIRPRGHGIGGGGGANLRRWPPGRGGAPAAARGPTARAVAGADGADAADHRRPGSLYRCMVITAVPFLLPLQFQLEFRWTLCPPV